LTDFKLCENHPSQQCGHVQVNVQGQVVIGVAMGCTGCTCTPQGGGKF